MMVERGDESWAKEGLYPLDGGRRLPASSVEDKCPTISERQGKNFLISLKISYFTLFLG